MANQATHLNVSMMNEQGTCGVEMTDENLCFFHQTRRKNCILLPRPTHVECAVLLMREQ